MTLPRTIIRYISGEFAKAFGLTLVIITSVWVLGLSILFVRHQVIGPEAFFMALPMWAVVSLKYTLPMAVLFGASVSYGRMSAENEIRAMEWNGIHVGWILLPASLIAVGASAMSLWLDCEGIPAANRRLAGLVKSNIMDILDRQLTRAAQGVESLTSGDFTVDVKGYDSATRTVQVVTIYQTDSRKRLVRRIDASSARIVAGQLADAMAFVPDENQGESRRKMVTFVFQNGLVQEFDPESTSMVRRYPVPQVSFDFSSGSAAPAEPKEMSLGTLVAYSRTAKSLASRLEARTDIYERLAMGLSPLFFVLLAAPLALVAKWKHTLTSFLPSLVTVIVIYYPLVMWAKVWGQEGTLDPLYGMFAGDAAVLLVAAATILILLRR